MSCSHAAASMRSASAPRAGARLRALSAATAAGLAAVVCGQLAEPVQQLAQSAPGGDGLPVLLRDPGLPHPEPTVADDHLRVRGPERRQPEQLAGLGGHAMHTRSHPPAPARQAMIPVAARAACRAVVVRTTRRTRAPARWDWPPMAAQGCSGGAPGVAARPPRAAS